MVISAGVWLSQNFTTKSFAQILKDLKSQLGSRPGVSSSYLCFRGSWLHSKCISKRKCLKIFASDPFFQRAESQVYLFYEQRSMFLSVAVYSDGSRQQLTWTNLMLHLSKLFKGVYVTALWLQDSSGRSKTKTCRWTDLTKTFLGGRSPTAALKNLWWKNKQPLHFTAGSL